MIDYLYIAILLVSFVLMYFANAQYFYTKKLLKTGFKTKAKVIDLIEVNDSDDNGYTYKPVFKLTDRNNNIITFQSEVSTNPAPYNIGDSVDIIYDTNRDLKKVISYWGLYRWTLILLSIAFPLLIIGGGYFLYKMG